MRKVTEEIVNAFLKGKTKRISNSYTDGDRLYLHGNCIAKKHINGLLISNAGWRSRTTRERLNAIPGVSIQQKNFEWYLNGKYWNGDWTHIPYKN